MTNILQLDLFYLNNNRVKLIIKLLNNNKASARLKLILLKLKF